MLLEVNASPSLAADTPSDYALKYGMLEDLLTVVDMERHLTSHVSLKQVCEVSTCLFNIIASRFLFATKARKNNCTASLGANLLEGLNPLLVHTRQKYM